MANLDHDFYIELGMILKEARLKMGFSYDTLADKINGIKTKSTLKRYEAGESKIDMETLARICEVLHIEVDRCLSLARNRSIHDISIFDKNKSMKESDMLNEMLISNGFSIGYDEEDAFLWINYPDGTLEVTNDILKGLYRDINVYIKFKLEDLKQSNLKYFKQKK